MELKCLVDGVRLSRFRWENSGPRWRERCRPERFACKGGGQRLLAGVAAGTDEKPGPEADHQDSQDDDADLRHQARDA